MLEARLALQNAATTGNGTAVDLGGQVDAIRAYIEGSAGVSAGAVQLEEARSPTYAGTWSPIGSPVTVVASTVTVISVPASGGMLAVRARISTNITGGTVAVELVAASNAGA